jgi:hypothetical protein
MQTFGVEANLCKFFFHCFCITGWSCHQEVGWFLVFNATFSYIMATSFSGGRSRREPPTMGKQLINFITSLAASGRVHPFL